MPHLSPTMGRCPQGDGTSRLCYLPHHPLPTIQQFTTLQHPVVIHRQCLPCRPKRLHRSVKSVRSVPSVLLFRATTVAGTTCCYQQQRNGDTDPTDHNDQSDFCRRLRYGQPHPLRHRNRPSHAPLVSSQGEVPAGRRGTEYPGSATYHTPHFPLFNNLPPCSTR